MQDGDDYEWSTNEVTGLTNQSVTLSCSDGDISVWFASYVALDYNPTTDCWFPADDILIKSCDKKKTCSFPVNNAAPAKNHCPGEKMLLYVMYDCV